MPEQKHKSILNALKKNILSMKKLAKRAWSLKDYSLESYRVSETQSIILF